MSESMIDRVGLAIDGAMFDSRQMPCGERQEFVARAAIEAMREPTESMVDEATIDGCPPRVVWGLMIDAALSEKP